MKLVSKFFDELTTDELYEILSVRTAVFVVEQKCPYQDPDGLDDRSLHVFYEDENGKIAAYLRAFPKDEKVVQMGRVLTIQRGTGLGLKILQEGIRQIREKFHPDKIFIEAQSYATGYYELEGFQICSEEFLVDRYPRDRFTLATKLYATVAPEGHRASDCIRCGMCEQACPQHLEIRRLLRESAEALE